MCALMPLEQPGTAQQRGEPAALNAICAQRALFPIAQVVQKGRSWSRTRRESGECRFNAISEGRYAAIQIFRKKLGA
jgi:hypothetical protein